MEVIKLACLLAECLCQSTVGFDTNVVVGETSRGIRTDSMLRVELRFPIQNPRAEGLFGTAVALFKSNEDPSIEVHTLDFAQGYLAVLAYFPLPYKSAERFPSSERALFIRQMAMYKIACQIERYLDTLARSELAASVPDPRHPAEIKWEKRRLRVLDLFRSLMRLRETKGKRSYSEYQ